MNRIRAVVDETEAHDEGGVMEGEFSAATNDDDDDDDDDDDAVRGAPPTLRQLVQSAFEQGEHLYDRTPLHIAAHFHGANSTVYRSLRRWRRWVCE